MSESHRLITLLRAIVILLAVQFVLGIWVDLFGSFPSTNRLGTAVLFSGDPVLTVHYAVAILVVLLAIAIVVRAFGREESSVLRMLTIGGLLSIVWASASGVEFILSGFTNNFDSFSMALGFIAATSFYGVAQALVLPTRTSPTSAPRSDERESAMR